jgi:hypothetical protein
MKKHIRNLEDRALLCCLLLTLCSSNLPNSNSSFPSASSSAAFAAGENSAEQELLQGLEQAGRLHGPDSPISFERLFELAQFYVEQANSPSISKTASELNTQFAKLERADQQYFAGKMLNYALRLAKNNRLNQAELFYLPVVCAAEKANWTRVPDLAQSGRALSIYLEGKGRLLECKRLNEFVLLCEGLKAESKQSMSKYDIKKHAHLLMKLHKYDDACELMEKALEQNEMAPVSGDFEFLAVYAEASCKAGKKQNLKALISKIEPLFLNVRDLLQYMRAPDIIFSYIDANLNDDAIHLSRDLFQGVAAAKENNNISGQNLFFVEKIATHFQKSGKGVFAQDVYKEWLSTVECKFGPKSSEYLEATKLQLDFYASNDIVFKTGEFFAKANTSISPKETSANLMQRVKMVKALARKNPASATESIRVLIKATPKTKDYLEVLEEESDILGSLDLNEDIEKLEDAVLPAAAASLPGDAGVFSPYVKDMKSFAGKKEFRGYRVFSFIDRLLSAKDAESITRYDEAVIAQLRGIGRLDKAIEAQQDFVKNLASHCVQKDVLLPALRIYAKLLEDNSQSKNALAEDLGIIPTARAIHFALQSALQAKCANVKSTSEPVLVAFVVDHNGVQRIKSASPVEVAQNAEQCVSELRKLGVSVPGYVIEFEANFQNSGCTLKTKSIKSNFGLEATPKPKIQSSDSKVSPASNPTSSKTNSVKPEAKSLASKVRLKGDIKHDVFGEAPTLDPDSTVVGDYCGVKIVVHSRLTDMPKMIPYIQDMIRRVKRSWTPEKLVDLKPTTVQFAPTHNGVVQFVTGGSHGAQQAIMRASPFQPLPREVPDDADVDVYFTFDRKLFDEK